MKTRIFVFSMALIFLFILAGCQQNTTPVAPQPGFSKQAPSKAAATTAKSESTRSLKADERTTNPENDLERVTDSMQEPTLKNETATGEEGFEEVLDADASISQAPGPGGLVVVSPEDFELRVDPNAWNKNWDHSDGLVTVRIRGEGFMDINPETVRMSCGSCSVISDPGEILPVRWRFGTYSLTAKFNKADAMGLIADPQRGETYEMLISFSMIELDGGVESDGNGDNGPDVTLPFMITILGKKPLTTDLYLVIRPKKWNKAWANADDEDNGMDDEDLITARINGEGFDDIVPGSLLMSYGTCEDPLSDTIAPYFEELGGISYVGKFKKSEAIALIEEPRRGDMHPIRVTGQLEGGGTFCLSYMILIVGKKSGEGPLTLIIRPKNWNMAWLESDEEGEVTARIKGADFDKIDPGTIQLVGPGGSISPLTTEFAGFAFIAKFRQSDAIGLIPNPPTQNRYDLSITGALTDGTPLPGTLTFSVNVKAKK
jgi:hypothetical protein